MQAFKLAHYHADNIDGIVRFDQFAILAQMVIGAIFSWFTTIFYSWRAWKVMICPIELITAILTEVVDYSAVVNGDRCNCGNGLSVSWPSQSAESQGCRTWIQDATRFDRTSGGIRQMDRRPRSYLGGLGFGQPVR